MSAPGGGPLLGLGRDFAVARRTAGLAGFGARVIAETLGRAFERRRLLVLDQDLSAAREVAPPDGVEITAFAGEWSALLPILTRRARARFERRFAAGRACVVARRGEAPIGYSWISTAVDPEIELLPLDLPPEAAYLWDLFVVLGERGGGVGSALASARMAHARGEGFRRGWRAVDPGNRASLRTAEKTGAVRVLGEIRWQRVLGRVRYREVPYGERPILRRREER